MVFWVLLCFETGANLLTDRQMGQPTDRQTNGPTYWQTDKSLYNKGILNWTGFFWKIVQNKSQSGNDSKWLRNYFAFQSLLSKNGNLQKSDYNVFDNEVVEVFKIKYVPFTHLKHKQADTTHYYSS